ncbi:MAG TPA: response regulator [Thermoanaerobaculia bacterium]|nr:response regulator [Thermoanaerobaculia bacterium]HUM29934.1 response regulator [Thermoanaerobaculia bacterium]HXK68199.1 response regulator [Thermoanaerobaculia bacterium]
MNQHKILIIDDSRLVRETLKADLSALGHELITGATGVEAVKLYNECRPDIVILDCLLPLLSGFVACQQIRNMTDTNQYPLIIMISGVYTKFKYHLEAKQYGANHFLTKPVSGESLQPLLEAFSFQKPVETPPSVTPAQDRNPFLVTQDEFQFCLKWSLKIQGRKKQPSSFLAFQSQSSLDELKQKILPVMRETDVLTEDPETHTIYVLLLDANRKGARRFLQRLTGEDEPFLPDDMKIGSGELSHVIAEDFLHSFDHLEWTALS